MTTSLTAKQKVTQVLMVEFRRSGFDGLSLSQIAEATGLGKASLYHHFPGGKDEMAKEVMLLIHTWVESEIIATLKSEGDPAERLKLVLNRLNSFYDSGRSPCLLEVMVAGETPEPVRELTRETFRNLVSGFQKLAIDFGKSSAQAKTLAENAVVGIQGGLILARGLKDPSPFRRQIKGIQQTFSE